MPLREYYCPQCDYVVRRFRHSMRTPNPVCLGCGEEIKIKISKCNFRLRGLGWAAEGYSTDIDDAERFWAKDGQPVGDHVEGAERYQQKKKAELVNVLNKVL